MRKWEVSVRPICAFTDGPAISTLAVCGFGPALASRMVGEVCHPSPSSNYRTIVADAGGKVFGFLHYGQMDHGDHTWEFAYVAVDPHSRRHGVAERLFASAEQDIRLRGGRTIYGETSTENGAALALLAKAGFTHVATLPDFYRKGCDLLTFAKSLDTEPRAT